MSDVISWVALFFLVTAFWNLAALAVPKVVEWLSKRLK